MSASRPSEWQAAFECGVEWIDLKDPSRGALGCPDSDLVQEMAEFFAKHPQQKWSVAGGEFLDWDPSVGGSILKALGRNGAIKWAFSGCKDTLDWVPALGQTIASLPNPSQAILVHYADGFICNALAWDEILKWASDLHCHYVLIDTYQKDGRNLLDHYDIETLRAMVDQARAFDLGVAVAGSLTHELLTIGARVGAAWVGVRGAVCAGQDRSGPFCEEKLKQAVAIVRGSDTTEGRREAIHVVG